MDKGNERCPGSVMRGNIEVETFSTAVLTGADTAQSPRIVEYLHMFASKQHGRASLNMAHVYLVVGWTLPALATTPTPA